ncbi:MAG: hypothetical protein WKF71_04490 [Pyrinomonadaceae bacterium]
MKTITFSNCIEYRGNRFRSLPDRADHDEYKHAREYRHCLNSNANSMMNMNGNATMNG